MVKRSSDRPILADLLGGLSLTGLLVPEAIAYSAIAGLPASFGIVGAVAGPLAYATIGRSRLAVVSATSGAAALLAAAIASAAIPGVSRVDCALAMTITVGAFFLLGSALRLGTLTSFISRAVLHGFGFGLALTISIRQLPGLIGVGAGQGSLLHFLATVVAELPNVSLPSLSLGAAALLFLGIARRFKFAPAGLILIVIATLAMRFGPPTHFGIKTAGAIVVRATPPHLPLLPASDWLRLAQFAFPIAVVVLAESWATIRSLAAIEGDPISAKREIAALGLANLVSGTLRGLPVGAGFSIGNANAQAGTKGRIGALVAALAVATLVLTASSDLALIPEPALAAIVISALTHALSPAPIVRLFRLGRDQWIALTAALGVLVLGVTNGLLVAVGLSVLGLLRRLATPRLSELGRVGLHDFVDCAEHPNARAVPGLVIIRPDTPLFFGNADSVLDEVARRAQAINAASIILSLEETDDLDSSTLEAMTAFAALIKAQGRVLILARAHDRVRDMLDRGGLASLASSSTFSVADAVRSAETRQPHLIADRSGTKEEDQNVR